MSHLCHAEGCTKEVKPELLMCLKHWKMVPSLMKKAVWDAYRPGQCDDKKPSKTWLEAAQAAIKSVYEQEQAAKQPRKANW